SLGNVVEPKTITQGGKNLQTHPPYGADILRLLVASSEYTTDVNIGKTFLNQVVDSMRKYRNTARFMLGNLNDFNYKDQVKIELLKPIDCYMLHQVYLFGEQVNQAYAEFSISQIVQALNNFTNVNLSAFYFEIVKDRLYADHANGLSRRAVQTVLYQILNVYALSLAPIVPHLAEEIYENYKIIGPISHNSVFQLGWYHLEKEWNNPSIASEFEILRDLRNEVNYLLEMARRDNSLEANVYLRVIDEHSTLNKLLRNQESDLPSFFITSSAKLLTNSEHLAMVNSTNSQANSQYEKRIKTVNGTECDVLVKKATLNKCPRCWNYLAIN
ncbi:10905_t:CDS:2, partial [Ambispora gerdemannii]